MKGLIDYDNSEHLKRAFLRKDVPYRGSYQPGDKVAFCRVQRGKEKYTEDGQTKERVKPPGFVKGTIIGPQGKDNMWVAVNGRPIAVAKEQLRECHGTEMWSPSEDDVAELLKVKEFIEKNSGAYEDATREAEPEDADIQETVSHLPEYGPEIAPVIIPAPPPPAQDAAPPTQESTIDVAPSSSQDHAAAPSTDARVETTMEEQVLENDLAQIFDDSALPLPVGAPEVFGPPPQQTPASPSSPSTAPTIRPTDDTTTQTQPTDDAAAPTQRTSDANAPTSAPPTPAIDRHRVHPPTPQSANRPPAKRPKFSAFRTAMVFYTALYQTFCQDSSSLWLADHRDNEEYFWEAEDGTYSSFVADRWRRFRQSRTWSSSLWASSTGDSNFCSWASAAPSRRLSR